MLIVLIGFVSGIVTALGLGGGTVLIAGLTLFAGVEQKIAQAVNLVFFIPTALTAIIIYTKKKIIKWNIAIPIICAGVVGAIIGANIAIRVDVNILKKLFGFFLGGIAIYELFNLKDVYKKIKLK